MAIAMAVLLTTGTAVSQGDLKSLVYKAPAEGYLGLHGAVPIYDHSYAVVIGVSNYTRLPELPGAVRDAKDVGAALREHGFDVELLLDKAATRSKIAEVLADQLPGRLKHNDRVLIYFAGHGVTVGSGEAQMGYLMPVEGDNERRASTGISMREIQAWIATYPSKHVLFAADSCYSGLALATRSTGLPTTLSDYLRQVTERDVRLAFTAGRADQEAHEWEGKGLFTYFFLQGLKGDADFNRDGILTSSELSAYLEPNVAQTALANWRAEQNPQMERSGQGEFIFLIREPDNPTPPEKSSAVAGDKGASEMPSEDADIAFWKSIQASSHAEDFEAYLSKFPGGVFVDLARTRLERLRSLSSQEKGAKEAGPATDAGRPDKTVPAAEPAQNLGNRAPGSESNPVPETQPERVLGRAGSQAELDEWNQIQSESDRGRRIELDSRFLENHPNSGLTPYIHYDLANLYLGSDPEKFILHGEEASREIAGLADMAAYLAFYYAETDRPDEAATKARLCLTQLERLSKPPNLSELQWAARKHELRAQAFYALGRSELSKSTKASADDAKTLLGNAANEFNQAIAHAPDFVYAWFRLAEAYLRLDQSEDGLNAFARAAALGGVVGKQAGKTLDDLYVRVHGGNKGLKELLASQQAQAENDLKRFREAIHEEAGMPIRTKAPSLKGRKP